jgi:hypothetical protein
MWRLLRSRRGLVDKEEEEEEVELLARAAEAGTAGEEVESGVESTESTERLLRRWWAMGRRWWRFALWNCEGEVVTELEVERRCVFWLLAELWSLEAPPASSVNPPTASATTDDVVLTSSRERWRLGKRRPPPAPAPLLLPQPLTPLDQRDSRSLTIGLLPPRPLPLIVAGLFLSSVSRGPLGVPADGDASESLEPPPTACFLTRMLSSSLWLMSSSSPSSYLFNSEHGAVS